MNLSTNKENMNDSIESLRDVISQLEPAIIDRFIGVMQDVVNDWDVLHGDIEDVLDQHEDMEDEILNMQGEIDELTQESGEVEVHEV